MQERSSGPAEPAPGGIRRLFIRDLVLPAQIGVHAREHGRTQRVRINIDLLVDEPEDPLADDIAQVLSYEPLVEAVRRQVADGHVKLVETLAERLARECLTRAGVRRVTVRVEKLDVYVDAHAVGVEIERSRTDAPTDPKGPGRV